MLPAYHPRGRDVMLLMGVCSKINSSLDGRLLLPCLLMVEKLPYGRAIPPVWVFQKPQSILHLHSASVKNRAERVFHPALSPG